MQPTIVHSKAFDIITWQWPPPSGGYPLLNTLDVMINSVVFSPGNLHQYPVLSCGKHLYDYHITKREGLGRYTKFWLKCLYQARIVLGHIQCILCVLEVSINLSLIGPFSWNFSDGGIFLLSYYFLRKEHRTIMLEPKQFINHHIFCFFLQNGRGNNIQLWIKLHKDSYGSVTSFLTCCTGTLWQRVSSRLFAENIEEWTGSSFRPSDEEIYLTNSVEFVVPWKR